MPYVSRAQAGKFHELEKEGKISPKTVHEFDLASKGLVLPEHVRQHEAAKKRSAPRG